MSLGCHKRPGTGEHPFLAVSFRESHTGRLTCPRLAKILAPEKVSATDHSLSAELRHAASSGDLGAVRCLVLEGANVNDSDHDGYTALTHAARQGQLEMVSYLLGEGARPDPHGDLVRFDSPLMVAALAGHLVIVKKLIECGADPSRRVGVALAPADYYASVSEQKEIHEYLSRLVIWKAQKMSK
jgi:ankyrin repeat protein